MRRALLLVPLSMAVWWFVLKGASLWLLRVLAVLPLALLIGPPGYDPVRTNPETGEWLFNVEVNTTARNLQTGQMQAVGSIEFAVEPDSVAFFAAGWFSYLALAASAGGFSRRQARRLLKGVTLQTAINILGLAAYAYINGYGALANAQPNAPPQMWLLKYLYHIIYLVVPFAGPFMVALLMHPEWRAYFGAAEVAPKRSTSQTRRIV